MQLNMTYMFGVVRWLRISHMPTSNVCCTFFQSLALKVRGESCGWSQEDLPSASLLQYSACNQLALRSFSNPFRGILWALCPPLLQSQVQNWEPHKGPLLNCNPPAAATLRSDPLNGRPKSTKGVDNPPLAVLPNQHGKINQTTNKKRPPAIGSTFSQAEISNCNGPVLGPWPARHSSDLWVCLLWRVSFRRMCF